MARLNPQALGRLRDTLAEQVARERIPGAVMVVAQGGGEPQRQRYGPARLAIGFGDAPGHRPDEQPRRDLGLDRVEARWPLRLHLEPGSRVPLHCTASGKLLLACMAEARRATLLAAIDFSPFTPQTITDAKAFAAELATIRQQDYSLDREEFLLGLVAIAVPVRDRHGVALAALACHAPSARLSLERAVSYLPVMQKAAARLGRTFPD